MDILTERNSVKLTTDGMVNIRQLFGIAASSYSMDDYFHTVRLAGGGIVWPTLLMPSSVMNLHTSTVVEYDALLREIGSLWSN